MDPERPRQMAAVMFSNFPEDPPMTWAISQSTHEEARQLRDRLVAFNRLQVPFTQDPGQVELNLHIKDRQQRIIAGINAVIYCWQVLYVDVLFVEEGQRRNRLGTILLREAESRAMAMGARLAHLDTFDFQARDFYLKNGYQVYGVLEDCPEGHRRYHLKKHLQGEANGGVPGILE
jgi:GNAT superfamily N-acetyltransferase